LFSLVEFKVFGVVFIEDRNYYIVVFCWCWMEMERILELKDGLWNKYKSRMRRRIGVGIGLCVGAIGLGCAAAVYNYSGVFGDDVNSTVNFALGVGHYITAFTGLGTIIWGV